MRQNKPGKASDTSSDAVKPAPPPDLYAYATQIITARLDRMLTHVEGVRAAEEIEPVHQMRVWSRRSRAALEVFRCCFPGKAYAELEREVKAVTDALGEARDLDVMIETLRARAERLPLEQRTGIESFVARLEQRRDKSQQPVLKALKRLESRDLARRFADLAAESARPRHAHGQAAESEANAHG